MTYRELLNELERLDEDQLQFEIMTHIDEEFYPVSKLSINDKTKDDRLEDGHPYFDVE